MERKGFLINKAFNKYLLASILTVAATQVANIVDAALVGNIIGPEGLAAVVISKPVLQAIYAITTLYVASSTMLTGMAIGNGNREKANTLFSLSMTISSVLGIILVAAGLLMLSPLSSVLCQSETLRPMANDFMRVTIISAIPQLMMYTLHQYVTIDGSPKRVTLAIVVGNIVNIGLDILFMKVFGWGIAGAAWATFAMYIVCSLMVLPHFCKKSALRFNFSNFKEHIHGREIITLGVPLFLSTALMSVQMGCYNSIATNYLGDSGLITMAVCMQLFTFSMIILTGTLRTIQPVGAILRGIGDSTGMLLLMKKAYIFMAICLAVYCTAISLFPTQIAAILGANSPDAMDSILVALPAFSLNIIMQALLYNLMPNYQFFGRHNLALFLSVAQTLLPIVGFWAMCRYCIDYAWFGFFLGQVVTAIVVLVWCAVIRRREHLYPVFLIPRTEYPILEFSYGYTSEEMHASFDQMSDWLKQQNLSNSIIFKVRIVAEELMSNIIRHSEQKDKNAYADVRLVIGPDAVTFALTDDGIPFNPIKNKDKGYGLMIANGVASQITYKYQFGENMTTVKISTSPEANNEPPCKS